MAQCTHKFYKIDKYLWGCKNCQKVLVERPGGIKLIDRIKHLEAEIYEKKSCLKQIRKSLGLRELE